MKKLVCVLALAALVASVNAAPFGANDLVVTRVGDGSGALTNSATPTFLDEYTQAGVYVGTIPLPTTVVGSNRRMTNSGSATSEGFLARSVDGQYLTLAGYDAAVGTATIATSSSATYNRVVARVDAAGNIDTTTAVDMYNAGNIRSATSTNGTDFWTSGTSTTSGSVRYTTLGSSTSVQLATTPTNIRVANIFSNQLYCSSATSTWQGVSTVGTGLPTTSGQTITLLNGFPTAAGPSAYDFWFGDSSTLYVADDRTTGLGGIQKWTLSGTTWSLAYTLAVTTTTGCRGLVGNLVGGNAVLFATTTDSKLVMVTDSGSGSPFTTLATSATNTAFRDVQIFPEPSSLLLLGLGALIRRR